MTIKIEINTGNDIFQPRVQYEVARLLRNLAASIDNTGIREKPIIEKNGNTVGHVRINND